ncbi:hypothetical protein MRB53_023162 [Persea americana]|uniref:Uncharacterized protein n=1 Tax=Persea americana TaxID=3435 RepID=A0ACC2L8Q9_PERAE|nr:hypothetical protein MRB53_023162 [Persea americana]
MGDNTEKKSTDTGMPSKPNWENLNHTLYLHHADQPGIILVPQPLVEDNYNTWVQSMSMALTAEHKISFVDESIKEPSGDKPDELQQWKRCNNLVKTWLLGSMSKEIASGIIHCKDARQMWLDLQERFSHVNTVQLFHIENEIHDSIQGSMTAKISIGKTSTQPEAVIFAVKKPSHESESEERGLRCAKCNKTNHNTKKCRAHLKCTFCGWKGHTFDYCCKRAVALETKQANIFSLHIRRDYLFPNTTRRLNYPLPFRNSIFTVTNSPISTVTLLLFFFFFNTTTVTMWYTSNQATIIFTGLSCRGSPPIETRISIFHERGPVFRYCLFSFSIFVL